MASADLPHNPDAQPFWDGAKEHRLLIRKCASCGRLHFPPRHLCPGCWSDPLEWTEASGRGRIHSFTIVHRAPNAAFAAKVPYALALVTLEEGPRIVTNVDYDRARPLEIDDPVQVYFEEGPERVTLPQFRREEKQS